VYQTRSRAPFGLHRVIAFFAAIFEFLAVFFKTILDPKAANEYAKKSARRGGGGGGGGGPGGGGAPGRGGPGPGGPRIRGMGDLRDAGGGELRAAACHTHLRACCVPRADGVRPVLACRLRGGRLRTVARLPHPGK
jgi:hypothetical protein